MFREIKLKTYQVEAILSDYAIRGKFQPRGGFHAFLNDRNWEYIPFQDAELWPLSDDAKVGGMQKASLSINKRSLLIVSLLDDDQVSEIQVPVFHRPIIIHLGIFAVRGQLHVPSDAPDEDLMDELHDYFPVSGASIYPIRPVAFVPQKEVPLLFVSRTLIQAYQVVKKGAED